MAALSFLTGALGFFQTTVGKWVGVGLLCTMAYFAGDIRGRRIEHAKCEEKARQAAEAAVAQDRTAQKQLDTNNATTLEELAKQKETADARIRELEKTLADGVIDCVYDDRGAPARSMRKQPGKGAGNAPASRPAVVPTPRARPAGDKG